MTYSMKRAKLRDLEPVMEVLQQRRDWLAARGSRQWSTMPFKPRMEEAIERGDTWLMLTPQGDPAGTLTMSTIGNPEFWTREELSEPALYLSKVATMPDLAGNGLGRLLVDWAVAYGEQRWISRVRWDSWRSNDDLHAYWKRIGAKHLRTEAPEGWSTGALFELSFKLPQSDMSRVTPPPKVVSMSVAPSERRNYAPTPYDLDHGGHPGMPDHVHDVAGAVVAGGPNSTVRIVHDGLGWLTHNGCRVSGGATERLTPGHPYEFRHIVGANGCWMEVFGDQV